MAFYESIIIIRQDVSSADVDKIVDDLKQVIKNYDGNVVKTEYWGLRTLAYEIQNNKKGHYYFMGIEANKPLLDELDRKTKLSESIIRTSLVRVDAISKDPSPILRAKSSDDENIVDVTSNRN
ncbi:30S ribosomal protein S6 [Candidatus Megaera venefica]|jgi:small subunit ribosomal protein S6|uniref:Small ribosomal subunit protein bS6 n=1 Tax=Candidatus Megaera venefica TaxID=2055910 RepID=A0ABU5NBF1_9RICK|nr:30S ribosomal protein S6 [Candidatus Megaera venefica]MBY0533611.1 30S ribosomal protein S6 [Rickettsiaceae bacterium]MEA0970467.1 30S ribosomal protein S6 [Candidatus Megaera venefica]